MSSKLGIQYHIYDIIGAEFVKRLEETLVALIDYSIKY